MGAKIGALVLALDLAKGALSVLLLPAPHAWWKIAFGVAAIVGHVRPIFLLWRGGGKGVATAAGMFAALVPWPTLAALVVWLAVLFAFGYVSLASLSAAASLPLAVLVLNGARAPAFAVSAAMAAFVFWTHRANIGRLRRGEEHRFGRKKTA
jgi:glycerol-3-phosphate acyltransferase PlsY